MTVRAPYHTSWHFGLLITLHGVSGSLSHIMAFRATIKLPGGSGSSQFMTVRAPYHTSWRFGPLITLHDSSGSYHTSWQFGLLVTLHGISGSLYFMLFRAPYTSWHFGLLITPLRFGLQSQFMAVRARCHASWLFGHLVTFHNGSDSSHFKAVWPRYMPQSLYSVYILQCSVTANYTIYKIKNFLLKQ